MFGSVPNAVGRYYKLQDGTRVQVAGVVENGKYLGITEDQQPAMFLPSLRLPSSQASLVVRSHRDPEQLAAAIRQNGTSLIQACRLTPRPGPPCWRGAVSLASGNGRRWACSA